MKNDYLNSSIPESLYGFDRKDEVENGNDLHLQLSGENSELQREYLRALTQRQKVNLSSPALARQMEGKKALGPGSAEYATTFMTIAAAHDFTEADDSSRSLLPIVAEDVQLQAYKDMANESHNIPLDQLDLAYGFENRTAPRSSETRQFKKYSSLQDKDAQEFTANIVAPLLESGYNGKDTSASLLPRPADQDVAQVYYEMAQPSSASRHIELSPFASAAPTLDRSSSFDDLDSVVRIEREFRQFAKSLLKEFKRNPQATLNQISRRVGELYNPITGKPAGKEFVVGLLKEAKRLALRSKVRNSVNPLQQPASKLTRSEKELLKAVTSLLTTPAPNAAPLVDEVYNSLSSLVSNNAPYICS